jgi:hypothetical protein
MLCHRLAELIHRGEAVGIDIHQAQLIQGCLLGSP